MPVISNHQSSISRRQASAGLPVLRPAMMSSDDRFVGFLRLSAMFPNTAGVVVRDLEAMQRQYVLDETLQAVLKSAKATLRRGPSRVH